MAEISFVIIECPRCQSMTDPDKCVIDEKGRGYCYRCGKHLFTDKLKRRELELEDDKGQAR